MQLLLNRHQENEASTVLGARQLLSRGAALALLNRSADAVDVVCAAAIVSCLTDPSSPFHAPLLAAATSRDTTSDAAHKSAVYAHLCDVRDIGSEADRVAYASLLDPMFLSGADLSLLANRLVENPVVATASAMRSPQVLVA